MPPKESNIFKYIDQDAIVRFGGNPMLSQFPMEGSVSGHHKSNHKGSSVEFAEYREYTPGEDPKRMDWRVLARTDRYFLKEFEAETNLRSFHLLDCSASMKFGKPESKFEFSKKLIGTLSYAYLNQGDAVGLSLLLPNKTEEIPARRNPSQLQDILHTLAHAEASGKDQVIKQLHEVAESIKSRALVIIYSDFFDDPKSIADVIHHLRDRKHEVVLFHTMDRQEVDFIFDRPTRFIDLEGGSSLLTEPSIIRDEYLKQMRIHLNEIKKICTETQSSHYVTITDVPVDEALKKFSFERSQI